MSNAEASAMPPPQPCEPTAKPDNFTHSRQSSVSSESSGASISSSQSTISPSSSSLLSRTVFSDPIDPLSRQYPKPVDEVNLDEMLARKPMRWTLGHYINGTSTREVSTPMNNEGHTALDLETKKRELLQAKEELRCLSFPK